MAKHIEPNPEQLKEWGAWLAARPDCIKQLAAKYPPELLYRMKPSGKRVCIYAYADDGTVSVVVSSAYNLVAMNRIVFGVNPENLEECDLPGPDEKVGLLPNPMLDLIKEAVTEAVQEVRNDPLIKHKRMVNNISSN